MTKHKDTEPLDPNELLVPAKQERLPMSGEVTSLQRLQSRHREMIRLAVIGMKRKDIAAAVGCSLVTVRNVLNSPLARRETEHLERMLDADALDIRKRIHEVAPEALEVLETFMRDEEVDKRVRKEIASNLLDRAGHEAPKRVEVEHSKAPLTYEWLQKIRRRAQESLNGSDK